MKRAACFAIGLVLLHAPLMLAQTSPAQTTPAQTTPAAAPEKSATTARLLGIVPGVGHMYAGETGHGIAYLAGTAAMFALTGGVAVTECLNNGLDTGDCGSTRAANVLAVATLGLWAWSIYDAGRAAHRTNVRSRAKQTSLIVAPGKWVGRGESVGRTLRVGLRVGR